MSSLLSNVTKSIAVTLSGRVTLLASSLSWDSSSGVRMSAWSSRVTAEGSNAKAGAAGPRKSKDAAALFSPSGISAHKFHPLSVLSVT